MFEILIISIGLVLVVEGFFYLLLAAKIDYFVNLIKNANPQKIRTICLSMIVLGLCLNYFTFKYYIETK